MLTIFVQSAPHELWQQRSWQVAVFSGIVTALLAVAQAFISYLQRRRELRWKQAELAMKYTDQIFDSKPSFDALTMADELSGSFKTEEGTEIEISQGDIDEALTVPVKDHSQKAKYIRHCFDVLFFYLERLEKSVTIKLVQWEDIKKPADYYVERLARHKKRILRYLDFTKYHGAKSFLNRFPEWKDVNG